MIHDLAKLIRLAWLRRARLALATGLAVFGVASVAGAENAGDVKSAASKPLTRTCASQSTGSGCIAGTNTSKGNALFGSNSGSGNGVVGQSVGAAGGYGVYGYSQNGVGVYAESSGANSGVIPLVAYNPASSPQNVIEGYSGLGQIFAVSGFGNMFITGEIYTGGSCQFGCSRTRQVASFGARTSEPTLDDVGESTLHDGVAHVALEPDFANAIDGQKRYVVLLTPEGDASLYVSNRSSRGFDVREVGGGHAGIAFAYRIVAKPYGVKDERLPLHAEPAAPPSPASGG